MMATTERTLLIPCAGETLLGVLHAPQDMPADYGVVIVVGGPQYRVGSHRQFVNTARALSEAGHVVLRFDYRGMGDSGAQCRSFDGIEDDIRAAIDTLLQQVQSLRGVVLYGLCDGASAALLYSPKDVRVKALILLNPWVRTEATQAATHLRYYYIQRLLQPEFWRGLVSAKVNPFAAAASLLRSIGKSLKRTTASPSSYVERMLAGLSSFKGSILVLLSGQDLTAKEFVHLCRSDARWTRAVSANSVTSVDLPEADHTFSTRSHLDTANRACVEWLRGKGITQPR
jgi:exosortase A-associated hydrolase 1